MVEPVQVKVLNLRTGETKPLVAPVPVDDHPLRYSSLVRAVERIIIRRVFANRVDGFTLEMALELADKAVEFHADPNLEE